MMACGFSYLGEVLVHDGLWVLGVRLCEPRPVDEQRAGIQLSCLRVLFFYLEAEVTQIQNIQFGVWDVEVLVLGIQLSCFCVFLLNLKTECTHKQERSARVSGTLSAPRFAISHPPPSCEYGYTNANCTAFILWNCLCALTSRHWSVFIGH